jgi:hypothetical protein
MPSRSRDGDQINPPSWTFVEVIGPQAEDGGQRGVDPTRSFRREMAGDVAKPLNVWRVV